MEKNWYVIHTYSGHENRVREHIERMAATSGLGEKIAQVIIPMEEVIEMKSGRKVSSTKKFLPGYVLVEMILDNEVYHLIADTPGVTNIVGSGRRPRLISQEEVDRILGRIGRGKTEEAGEAPFSIGDAVKVIDGPFSDFTGVAEEINFERSKIKVMVTIFGRPTPVELDILQVERLTAKG